MSRQDRSGRPNPLRLTLTRARVGAGLLAPVPMVALLAVAQWRTPHSNLHDEMSDLGDRLSTGWGLAFELAQYGTALLVAAVAAALWRTVPSSRIIVALLAVNVAATVGLGQTPCRSDGAAPWCDGPSVQLLPGLGGVTGLHGPIVVVLGATIVAVLAAALLDLRRTGPYGLLAKVSGPLLAVAVFATGAYWILSQRTPPPGETPRFVGLAERTLWGTGHAWLVAASALMVRQQSRRRLRPFNATLLQESVAYGSSRRTIGLYQTYTIDDPMGFRRWLDHALTARFVRPEQPRPRPADDATRPFTVTLGVSRAGLEALGIDYRWRASSVTDAFGEGMGNRFELLGDDPGTTALDEAHLLVWVTAESEEAVAQAKAGLDELERCATRVHSIDATPGDLAKQTEPFGWADGISNPWIRGLHDPADLRRAGGGKVTDRGFQQMALGEFLLGEIDETDDVMPVPDPAALFHHGTFLVVRELAQHSDRFWRLAKTLASREPRSTSDDMGAKLMGRRTDGTPLAATDPRFGSSNNHFLFEDDPEGLTCPVGAHIRRANPRDSLGFDGVPAHRHRIIRRGMPYRRPNGDEGLIFVCLNARPSDQFEFIQIAWLNDGQSLRLGRSPDPVAGAWADGRQRIISVPGPDGPRFARLARPLVTTLSGGYFFVPAIAGLRYLAGSEHRT